MNQALKQWWLVTRREIHQLIVTPVFWVLSGVFFFIGSIIFLSLLILYSNPQAREDFNLSNDVTISVMEQLFFVLHYFLMIQIPLLTMRSIAEDRRTKVLNLLRTMPMGNWSYVLGKFSASIFVVGIYLLFTLAFPLLIEWISEPRWRTIFCCYLALFLTTIAYIAIGLFFSAITESQVIAAVLTYVFLFGLVIFTTLSESFVIQALVDLAKHLTSISHIEGLLKGQILLTDIAYFILVAVFFLFLSVRQIESLKWRDQS